MSRAPSLLVMVGAGVALVWVTVSLQRMFVEERDGARAAVVAKQKAREQYARGALERKLDRALDGARLRIDTALAEPLAPADGLLLVQGGAQRLPRLARYAEGEATNAQRLHSDLASKRRSAFAVEEGPFAERVALLGALEKALDAGDDAETAQVVRDFLNHQSRFVLPVTRDLPLRVAFLEAFVRGSSPDRALMQALLRDGLRGTKGHRIVGLQPLLLQQRERFTREDFTFLAGRVQALSRASRVEHDDFETAATAGDGAAVTVPKALAQRALIANGAWYAEPVELDTIRGVRVDLAADLADVTLDMRAAGLLAAEDSVVAGGALGDVTSASEVPVRLVVPALAAEIAAIDDRYTLKAAMAVALFVLVAGVAALVALLYRRERRYLEGRANFVATMSHELRTPIASLRLMGETLERRLEGVESARDFPSRIVAEVDRLNFLVENILSFNRLERATVVANLQPVPVRELVEAAQTDVHVFTRKPVSVRIEAGDTVVRADPELMKLVFSNLIHNSCKYNTRDTVDVVVTAGEDARGVVVTFEDNGAGIRRGEWESVFTAFVRARASEASSGFGLGLALCRRILSLHDGEIVVSASSDSGTTFRLTFPAAREGSS